MWTNGEQISHYHRKDPNYFEDITDIPKAQQSLKDILSERFTLKDLLIKDKIANERKSLKNIILEMENEVLANAGVDVFEEVFKLVFTFPLTLDITHFETCALFRQDYSRATRQRRFFCRVVIMLKPFF